jgi:isopenicillin N synthase-like dioxygenase
MDSKAVDQASLQEAPLSVIDWGRLRSGDEAEGERLLNACEGQGFFYLDLSCDQSFLQDHRAILSFMDQYFHQDLSEKMKDDRQSDTHG